MSDFTCEQFAEQLFEFVEGQLPDQILVAVQAHLGQCPHCGGMIATYRATVVVTRALPRCTTPLPADLESRLRLYLERNKQKQPPPADE